MCELLVAGNRERIGDYVRGLAGKGRRVGILFRGADARVELLAEIVRSAGVKELKFIWCLCRKSPDLERFFSRQPSDEVLVIDPGHFRKNLNQGREQLLEFCEIEDPKAMTKAESRLKKGKSAD